MTYCEPKLQKFLDARFNAPQKYEKRMLAELSVNRDTAELSVLSTMHLMLFERLHYLQIPLPLLVVLSKSGLSRNAILLALYFYGEQSIQCQWAGNHLPERFAPVKATRAELAGLLGLSVKQFDAGKDELILHDMLFVEPYSDGRQTEANLYRFYLPDELTEQIHKYAPRFKPVDRQKAPPREAPADEAPQGEAPAAEATDAPAAPVEDPEQATEKKSGAAHRAEALCLAGLKDRLQNATAAPVDKNAPASELGDTPLPKDGEALEKTAVPGSQTKLHTTVPQPPKVPATPAAAAPDGLVAKKDYLPCKNSRGDNGYAPRDGLFVKAEKPLFHHVADKLLVAIQEKGWTVWQGIQLLTIFEDSYRQADHSTIHPLRLGRFLIKLANAGKLNIPNGFASRHCMSIDLSRSNRPHNVWQ